MLKLAKTESLKSPITNLATESYSETVSFISQPPNLSTYLILILMLSSHHSFLTNFIFEKFSKFFSSKILQVLCTIWFYALFGSMHYLVPYSSKNFRLSQLKQNHLTSYRNNQQDAMV